MTPLLPSLLLALALPATAPRVPEVAVDVPYLTQTEALCGGAAVAMVFRYWGDVHASVSQFTALVDRRVGGIATSTLAGAVRQRGWNAVELSGSLDTLREAISMGRPIIVLLAEPRRRFHYVVVTAMGNEDIWFHDPSWGARRRIAIADFVRRWRQSGFWGLSIQPSTDRPGCGEGPGSCSRVDGSTLTAAVRRTHPPTICDRLLDDAVAEVQRDGLARADASFGEVRARCPDSAGPLRELAGVRFAERQWRAAAGLAEQAVRRDEYDDYAWDVLGSSRFMQADSVGALDAWNHIGKPRLDLVQVEGTDRTRSAVVVETLGLSTGALLTPGVFRLAERRLNDLPDRASARIDYRPGPDGYADVDIVMTERPGRPRGQLEWGVEGARTAIDREVQVNVPGRTGQGELWTATWRWWGARPAAGLAFSAPRSGKLGGIWRVDTFWEQQTYGAPDPNLAGAVREERLHGGVSVSNWLTADVRYRVSAGLDSWNRAGRTVSVGGAIERRLWSDRLSFEGDLASFLPLNSGSHFHTAGARLTFRSSREARGAVYSVDAGLDAATAAAPLALWPGAGDGRGREALLRGHPLLTDGAINGPAFGRQLTFASLETRRWIETRLPVRLGLAAFLDAVHARERAAFTTSRPFQADAGIGIRMRVPGHDGTLRIDFARGLQDGAHALTAGWQF